MDASLHLIIADALFRNSTFDVVDKNGEIASHRLYCLKKNEINHAKIAPPSTTDTLFCSTNATFVPEHQASRNIIEPFDWDLIVSLNIPMDEWIIIATATNNKLTTCQFTLLPRY